MFVVINLWRKRHHKKKHSNDCDGCDGIELCDCDGPDCCDFGLFSFLLTLGAVTAGATRAPVVDRAGRAAILGYRRWLSHRWPAQCRYTPTCSAYGLAAVERHGLAVGGRLAAARLRRCTSRVPRGTHDPLVP
jgi:putative membrane protein insertion efficiency factor